MAGPGAIATTLLLSRAAGTTSRLVVVILLVCLTCVICFALAVPIVKHWATLGNIGNAVLSRLLEILLAAFSVQFVLDGGASACKRLNSRWAR
ncbi:hypothetical protein FXB40_03175 [Bradyrhizobium rifense]|uniref:UPF0056 membrane protein n=1 Tax=Bradyrhizobium rifense TaxID=515499 RepID=A0A5D3KUG2_9BRAD|nr:hypothetical protein FXB40_03175 [Bradyrhizobium rifense]